MATVISSNSLANDIEDELRAKNLSHFLLRNESKGDTIVIEVYENQAWHPVLQTWGSVVGVHLNAVLDRSPYTDESGTKVLSGTLAEVKPLNKYKWQGAWTVRAEAGVTDATGFQYAVSWGRLANRHKPSTVNSPLYYVRRRRFTRKMIVDPDPPSKALPYEITLKVLTANIQGMTATTSAYVEIFLDRHFLDRTATTTPNWNHKLSKKIMEIDPEMTITFVLYSKKVLTIVNPFQSGPAPVEMIHRGTAHIVVRDFLDNLAVINREDAIDVVSPTGQKIGSMSIRVDVVETRLFGVVPAFDDSLEELKKRTTDALPYDLRYNISTLDNDENAFLKVLVSSVIEGRDVLTQTDLVDVVREASYLQGVEGDPSELGNDGKPKPHQQLLRYPSGKPRYGKVITLPSNLDEHKSDATVRQHFEYALRHEETLQAQNEKYDRSLPSVSSVFEAQTLAVNGYDSAYQPHQSDELKSDYYDLEVYATPEYENEPEPVHVLRWTSYHDYVMMIAEMVKVQHAHHHADTVPVVVRHTCKVQYGCQSTPDSKPTSWLPVTFTVDSEAEFLVIRESRVAREDQQDMFDLILAFDQVECVVVKNTYHLSSHYVLDLRVHSASSHHLRNTLGKLHVETTDGRQRVDFTSEAFRKGSVPPNQPGTVIFQQDSHTFLLPPSVVHGVAANARECLHVTFSSEENGNTDTPAVQGRMDLPLSSLIPTMGTNVADCQVTFKNLQQQYELRLKVTSISNLFWRDPAKDLFNPLELDLDPAKLFKNEEADPYFVVYFADENGQIIPLNGATVGAASVVRDLAGNLVFLGTAGMVNNKGESAQSVVGNVAKDLLYLGTAGLVGGKEEKKKQTQGFDRFDSDNTSGHGASGHGNSGHGKNIVSNVGDAASNLLHMSTGGMVGKKKEETSQHGGPQRSASTMLKQGAGNFLGGLGVGSHKGALEQSRNGNNLPTPPNPKQRPVSMNENKRQSMSGAGLVGGAASGLLKVGQGSIQATSNVIVGTSNVAVNVLTLGNSSIVSTMNKTDAIYQSNVAHKTNNPTWDEEIVLSTEKYGDVMRAAKFLLIEVWDKRTALADVCLGEVYVPIVCAHTVDPETPDDEIPRNVGHRKYPLQLSKHMKINRALAKRMPDGLGAMRAQLLYREACEYADATAKERGDHDPIKVNFIVQMKPVGALDFAWPSRVISTEQTADSMEQDLLYVRLRHDGLHVSVSLVQPYSDRVKMLLECREKSNEAGLDKNAIHMVVPYDQISVGEAAILTTDALMCQITFTRVVVSTTQKGKEVERPVTLDVLIGPCPASDVFAILNQRVSLTHFRSNLKAIAAIKPELDQLDAIGGDLQQDILAISHDIEDLSVQSNYAPILESLLEEKETASGAEPAKVDEGVVIFADKTNRMSVTYFSTKLQVRVLMARQAFLKAYFWHVREFSKFAVGKVVGKTVLPNFDKEIDIDAIAMLTKRARATIKFGDPSKLGDGTDSDDSDEDEERVAKRAAKREVSTSSLVQRIGDIMTQLAKDVRALFFQGYRRKFTSTYLEFLASKLVYEQYLVIVGYLANILLDDSTEAQIPTLQAAQSTEKSLSSQMWHLTSVTTSVMTLGTVKLSTGNAVAEAPKSVAKKIDSQKKHDLISFVLSQDSLFEQYLHANLFSCEYKFSHRPHLSMCLDFDVLIGKFADMLNDNIQMWNSKALKVFMCRKVEEGVAPSRLPWDITTMRDDYTGNEMYISHIPESIQIQLNVQIGMKKINTTGMGDNLSLMSIKRIYEINLKIAKAIARAYLSLAVEYENFLEDTISALSADDLNAGNRVTNMIQNVGMKMIDVSTLGMLNVAGEPASAGQSARTQVSQEESDELLCFLMSIVNDCTRINKEHIPQSVLSFVKEFGDNGDAVLTQAGADGKSAQTSGVLTPGLTAAEEINGYFFNPIKAIKSVSRNAINCLTNQVFFHGDLREYFLRTFSDHMQVKPAATGSGLNPLNTPLFSVKLPGMGGDAPSSPNAGGEQENEEEEEQEQPAEEQAPPVENPIATIVATLQDMYGFTSSHVQPEDQHRIVHNCLKKLIMRYLIMLRDVLVQKNYNRMSVALNKGLDTGLKVGRTVLNITTLGLADHLHGGGDELDRSSSHHASHMTAESFTAAQLAEIREDLQTIMEAHLEVTDDSVAELLQFFNKAVNTVIAGVSCDPRTIDKMLLDRFHQTPPVYSPDLLAYDRALESFIGLNASTHELSHSEMETRMNKAFTVQFQDFTCIKLKDYRVCVVRVTFANITVQSSILSSNMVGSAQIKWKDILRFEHVKGYQNKEVLVELVEIRPMGMRRELILARVRIQLSELSQFITPEPYPAATNGKIVANPAAGHSGWFVLEEVPAEIYTAKGMTNMLRDVTLGTLNVTKAVTDTTVNATVTALMSPMRLGADEDGMGSSSTGRDSVGKSSHHTNPGATTTPGTSVQNTPAKARNNYLSILSSDQPRDDVEGPQLKIRIRIVEEKE